MPKSCRIVTVAVRSPAEEAGLKTGDVVKKINGVAPKDAAAVADMIQDSGPFADIDIVRHGRPVTIRAHLRQERPRLGTLCDFTGWRKGGVTEAGNESVTDFEGPYAVTFSGVIDENMLFVRLQTENHSTRTITIAPDFVAAADAEKKPMKALSPGEAMRRMHGDLGKELFQVMQSNAAGAKDNEFTPRKKDLFFNPDYAGAKADADYVAHQSLTAEIVAPEGIAEGVLYYPPPKTLPITVTCHIDAYRFKARLGAPQGSKKPMSFDAIRLVLEKEKEGAPLRITLGNGRIYVGHYSKYDDVNETLWLRAGSEKSAFPLNHVRAVQVIGELPGQAGQR
jgi:hypothetical protein